MVNSYKKTKETSQGELKISVDIQMTDFFFFFIYIR